MEKIMYNAKWAKAALLRANRWESLSQEQKDLAKEQMKDWASSETWAFVPHDVRATVTR